MDKLQAAEFQRHQNMVRGFFRTGVSQVFFGILKVMFAVVGLSHPSIHDIPGYLTLSSHMNIWSSILFCIVGGLGISTRDNHSSSLVKSYYRLSLLCVFLSLTVFFVDIFGLVSAHASTSSVSEMMIAIHWILTPLAVIQLILFVVAASYKCCRSPLDSQESGKQPGR